MQSYLLKVSCSAIIALLSVSAAFPRADDTASAAPQSQVKVSSDETNPEAAEPAVKDLQEKKLNVSGYGAIECGEIEAGHFGGLNNPPDIEHMWLGHNYASLSVLGTLNRHFSALISLEARMWYTTPLGGQLDKASWGAPVQNYNITIPNAVGIVSFGDKKKSAFTLKIGRFEYKYNPQSMDLGEYLFRAGCYPAYITTNFDLSLARINGIDFSYKLFDMFRQDLLVTTMHEVRPFHDFSITYIAGLTLGSVFDVSGGVQFDRLFSTDENETHPQLQYNQNGYLKAVGDTAYYTFAGTKLMLRFMVDPKKFFEKNEKVFDVVENVTGKSGFVFYSEAAVLGLENYPKSTQYDSTNLSNIYGYDNIFEKMPVTLGFTWPTHPFLSYGLIPLAITMWDIEAFKKNWAVLGGTGLLTGIVAGGGTWLLEKFVRKNVRLDVLSVEAEWFGSKYADNYSSNANVFPVPSGIGAGLSPDGSDYLRDDWKWAVYAKKTIFGGLSLIGLVGRDHLRTETFIQKNQDFEASLIKNNHWYWMLKIKYGF
jgi:hypothetical protein